MKKILILIMSCNQDFFKKQEQQIKETYLKKVEEYDNIDYCVYSGDETIEQHYYNKYEKHLYLRCEDGIRDTFKKTYYAFKYIKENFNEYDYIFRTNTSTYINIDLLNYFVQHKKDDEYIWCGELHSRFDEYAPGPLDFAYRGNGLLLSQHIIDIVLKYGVAFLYIRNRMIVDDLMISTVFNYYHMINDRDYTKYCKCFGQGYYKMINVDGYNGNKICSWGNQNLDWDFIKNFIMFQFKNHYDRSQDGQNLNDLYNAFKDHIYSDEELKESYDKVIEYSKNPSVFLGSIIGFISLDEWLELDKKKLFYFEAKNVASNEHYNTEDEFKWF